MPILTLGLDLSGIETRTLHGSGCSVDPEFLNRCRTEIAAHEIFVSKIGDRIELFAANDDGNDLASSWHRLVQQHFQVSGRDLKKRSYHLYGHEAIGHFLRVAIGMDAGREFGHAIEEFRKCFALAQEIGLIGPSLNRLFQRGLWLAEKVRIEINLQRNAITPESVVTNLAQKIFGDLRDHTALIVGHNAVGDSFVEKLRERNIGQVLFAENGALSKPRTPRDRIISKDELAQALAQVDLLFFLDEDLESFVNGVEINHVMTQRNNAPLLFVSYADASPPDRLKRMLDKIYNVYYYNNDDLEQIVAANLRENEKASEIIDKLIEFEIKDFLAWVQAKEWYRYGNIIGKSQAMQSIFELVARISQTDISVLIDGESGTGKELVARSIHEHSRRSRQKFITVNCGAVPESLLESELFGHVRGAFTGATANKKGLFEEANHGTIFLDEIGETSQSMQVKLLRFLQEGEIKPVGSNEMLKLDVRLITATNRDLAAMVDEGSFRQDLYYRLNVIQITVPPLRDRRDDILPLAEFFVNHYASKFHKTVFGLEEKAKRALCNYYWPGNVRELENTIERAVALTPEKRITFSDLPPAVVSSGRSKDGVFSSRDLSLKELEKRHIEKTLRAHNWNYELVTKILGIGRTTLWRKMKEYEISNS